MNVREVDGEGEGLFVRCLKLPRGFWSWGSDGVLDADVCVFWGWTVRRNLFFLFLFEHVSKVSTWLGAFKISGMRQVGNAAIWNATILLYPKTIQPTFTRGLPRPSILQAINPLSAMLNVSMVYKLRGGAGFMPHGVHGEPGEVMLWFRER